MLKLKLKNDHSEDSSLSSVALTPVPKSRIKLNLGVNKKSNGNPVRLRLRTNKVISDGFDVQSPDREEDPTVEEAIVLRMLPNTAGLDSLRKACESNDFTGIEIRFEDRRHAVVSVNREDYFAQLMDLPTISEVHKTLDRRNIFKTTDVSQILLVTHKVGEPKPDLNVFSKFTNDPQLYPHGLTPPMYNVRNRRFQERMSTKTVESLEAQVEELLRRDAEAKEVTAELLAASAVAAQQALAEATRAAAKAWAEESDMEVDEELDEELERAMVSTNEEGDEENDENDEVRSESEAQVSASDDEDEDDVEDEDDEDEDRNQGDHGDDIDDDVRQHNKQLREEIRELELTIEAKAQAARKIVNNIMRVRHTDAVARLQAELEKKKTLLRDSGGLENENQNGTPARDSANRVEGDESGDDEDEEDEDIVDDDEDMDEDAPELPPGAGLPEIPGAPSEEVSQESAEEARLREELSNTFGLGDPNNVFELETNQNEDDLGLNIENLGDIGQLGELDVELDFGQPIDSNEEAPTNNNGDANDDEVDIDDLF